MNIIQTNCFVYELWELSQELSQAKVVSDI